MFNITLVCVCVCVSFPEDKDKPEMENRNTERYPPLATAHGLSVKKCVLILGRLLHAGQRGD